MAEDRRAVIYARVSVREEDINNQVQNIKAWAEKNGYEVVAVFKDEAITGASDPLERPKFQMMLEFMRDNDIRTILVYDISRFGRSLVSAVNALQKLLDEGFTVVFTRFQLQASDLHDMATKSVIYSLLMAAEFERDMLHQRMEAAKAAGKIIHRPPTPIPFDRVRKLLKKGYTLKQIYAILKEEGALNHKHKGQIKALSYRQFVERCHREGIYRRRGEEK